MSAIIAIGHIVGAVFVLFAFGVCTIVVGRWESERNQKAWLQEASLALGVPVGELDKSEHQERFLQFAADRYSSELLRNRLSDFAGLIRTGWGWLSNIFQAGTLIGVIWYSTTDDPSNSVYAWTIIGIALFFWIVSIFFSLACKLLTGRFPGQAREARKLLAEAIQSH